MATENQGTLGRGIEQIFNHGSLIGVGEAQLLRQYAAQGDEAAFEALVRRHGPMVLRVCRRMLYDPRDVEDAFQATFLVLLRRAGSVGDADALSPWLHGVAYRVSARIRARAARRPVEERKAARPEAMDPGGDAERHELQAILDQEIHRLPEKYRKPLVLCYLEGRTQEEAARRLHCSAGSVRGRLDRAREKLRHRLVRRGLAPTAGLIASVLDAGPATAAVPPALVAATLSTLARAATAHAVVATGASAAVRELADGLIRTMIFAKVKVAMSVVAAGATILALGIILAATLPRSVARDGAEAHAAGSAPQRRDSNETPQTSPLRRAGSSMELQVLDQQTGRPLAGAVLTVNVERKDVSRVTTDNAGRASIPVPSPPPSYLAVKASKDGFATMTGFIRHPTIQAGDIPATYTLAIHRVETVTGVVRDEQGRPVAGALVEPMTWMRSGGGGTDRDEFERPVPVRTDSLGRWRCEDIPAEIPSGRMSFRFSHPDYQPVDLPTGTALDLIRRGAVTVLPRGLDLRGRVVDQAGAPIGGARVYRGADRFGMGIPQTATDPDGRFGFTHVAAGETILTVQAAGHAPDLRKIVVGPASPPVDFRLEPGRTIRGRVVNAKGDPVESATLVAEGWRGYRTLDWRTTTDDDGRFQWNDAPPDRVWIDVLCEGYLRIRRRELAPSDDRLTISLIKVLKVRGTVVDAETLHAIPSFTLVPGSERGGDGPTYWDRNGARAQSAGKFEIQFDQSAREGYRLRIESDGYAPAISRLIRDDEDQPVINFVLQKGTGVSGVVQLGDGSPLAGADLVLVTPSQPAFITNGGPPERDGNRVVKTGADGRFAFPAQDPPYTIVALHDQGFAERSFDAKSSSTQFNLTVRPWGRVEGTVRIAGRPGAGQSVSLIYEQQGDTRKALPWWSGNAICDASGRFALNRVIPGEVSIARAIEIRPMTTSYSHTVRVDVAAGGTARVAIGATGRPVIGKVTCPDDIAQQVDWSFSHNWLHRKQAEIQPPAGLDFDAKQKWHEAWRHSPEGKAFRLDQRWYAVKLESDGSFRVDDVEAGPYDLSIIVNERPLDPHTVGLGNDELGHAQRAVVIPDMKGARSDEPLDLGQIRLEPAKKRADVKIGDPAPQFQIEDVDGKRLGLADYRGKYVMLDFWATWCGPCLAETPHLKATFEAFGKDARLVMIGLSLDKSREDPRQYAAKHGLGWIQGFLGEWADGKLPDAYGVRGIPSIWLIGPDGKVFAKDLRGAQIKTVLAEALARP